MMIAKRLKMMKKAYESGEWKEEYDRYVDCECTPYTRSFLHLLSSQRAIHSMVKSLIHLPAKIDEDDVRRSITRSLERKKAISLKALLTLADKFGIKDKQLFLLPKYYPIDEELYKLVNSYGFIDYTYSANYTKSFGHPPDIDISGKRYIGYRVTNSVFWHLKRHLDNKTNINGQRHVYSPQHISDIVRYWKDTKYPNCTFDGICDVFRRDLFLEYRNNKELCQQYIGIVYIRELLTNIGIDVTNLWEHLLDRRSRVRIIDVDEEMRRITEDEAIKNLRRYEVNKIVV
jgi:hypothetical protein